MDKIDGQNKISVTLGLSPTDFKYWKDVNFIDMIELNSPVPITDVTISRNPDGTVAVEFKYQADIQGTQIEVKLDPANTGIPALMRATPTSQSMVIEPKNNKTAYYYEDQYYQLAEMTTSLGTAIGALAIVFFLIGLAYGKVIAVEMAAVIQITYLSVVTLNQTNPCITALTSLKFSNGFNFVNSYTLLG